MLYLPDMERATGGIVSVEALVNMQRTLDIGCGMGAYVNAMRQRGSQGKFVGVDVTRYTRSNSYNEYEHLIFEDIRLPKTLEEVNRQIYDCVISIGLPPQAFDFVARSYKQFRLFSNSLVVLVTDHHISDNQYADFSVYHGTMVVDESILVKME